jgi:ABC-2 type transport system ATP-binding protein
MTMLTLSSITKQYGKAKSLALSDVSFELSKGQVVGLVGSNGAGKTTLIRLLVGLLRPTSGQINIAGKNVGEGQLAMPVGYVPQFTPAFPGMSGRDLIEFVLVTQGFWGAAVKNRRSEIVEQLGLELFEKSLVWNMSGGESRLTLLAAALSFKPPLIVLDEPTAGLDTSARRRFWKILSEVKLSWAPTIILVTHDINAAEQVIDQALLLHTGKLIFAGTVNQLRHNFSPLVQCQVVSDNSPGEDWKSIGPGRWQLVSTQDKTEILFAHANKALKDGASEVTIGAMPLEDVVSNQLLVQGLL